MKLQTILESTIDAHLQSRGVDPTKTSVIIDRQTNRAVFLLYNLSGQLVGYQQYNPAGSKDNHNDPRMGKYFSYATRESPKTAKLGVWGLQSLDEMNRFFFITEGIFDAVKIHNAGYPAIAVLTNNPLLLRSWLFALQKITIVVADNDAAGASLKKLGTYAYSTPEPYKDLGDMFQPEATRWLQSIIHQRKLS